MKEDDETPAAFLAQLGKSLKGKEGVDVGLAEIVSSHLLTVAPTENCVAEALTAVIALAEQRVNPRKEDADG